METLSDTEKPGDGTPLDGRCFHEEFGKGKAPDNVRKAFERINVIVWERLVTNRVVSVFEKESSIGGVWAESRAYPGLRSNNPKEAYAFSDFDYPESADEFPTAGQIRSYLESYAENFDLNPHIRLGTEVLLVSRRKSGTR